MSEFQNRFSLEGKKVLLTGASKGIGATTAEVLADAGADLILSGRDESQLMDTAKLVESKNRTAHILPADLTSAEAAWAYP